MPALLVPLISGLLLASPASPTPPSAHLLAADSRTSTTPATPTAAAEVPDALRTFVARRAAGDLAGAIDALAPKAAAPAAAKSNKRKPGVAAAPSATFCGGGPLEPWCALLRGEALLDAGATEAAIETLKVPQFLDPKGPSAARALTAQARALLQAGKLDEAIPALRLADARRPSPALRLALADALARRAGSRDDAAGRRDRAAAVEIWRALFVGAAPDPVYATARARLEEAHALSTVTAAEWLRRAEHLLRLGIADEALASAESAAALVAAAAAADAAAGAPTGELALRARLVRGKALAKLKRFAEAEEVLAALDAGAAPHEIRAEAGVDRARAALARGALDEARARFDAVAAAFPRSPEAEEAGFLAAWSYFNAGDFSGCAKRFEAFAQAMSSPRAKRLDEALWYAGFCSRLAGDGAAAAKHFDTLARISPALEPQALYWRARQSEGPGGGGADAKKEVAARYRKVIAAAPASWYAWLARMRLAGDPDAAAGLPEAQEPKAIAPASEREIRAALLHRAGLEGEARAEMEAAHASVRTVAEAKRAAGLCAALGMYDRAYAIARVKLLAASAAGDAEALGLTYPRAYTAELEAAAKASGIDPYFAWSIMRRESAFDPQARSPAQAHGLMQLLLPVAQRLASEAGSAEVPTIETLRRPAGILPLASRYLAQLMAAYKNAALAAAAYNGGEAAVAAWLRDRPGLPIDEFVERIPYKETRGYVKGVMGDYFTYRAVWRAGGETAPLE